MPNLNKVMLMGNLTRDPELKYLPSGTALCEFGMAVNRKWQSKNGQSQDETCFVDCQAWAKTGELISQYCAKGRPLFVEGRLKLDQWEGKDGTKRSKLRVVVENFQFLGGRESGATGSGAPVGSGNSRTAQDVPESDNFQIDDDIPF